MPDGFWLEMANVAHVLMQNLHKDISFPQQKFSEFNLLLHNSVLLFFVLYHAVEGNVSML